MEPIAHRRKGASTTTNGGFRHEDQARLGDGLGSHMGEDLLYIVGRLSVLKVWHTIADLAGAEPIGIAHVTEALEYRPTG